MQKFPVDSALIGIKNNSCMSLRKLYLSIKNRKIININKVKCDDNLHFFELDIEFKRVN